MVSVGPPFVVQRAKLGVGAVEIAGVVEIAVVIAAQIVAI
jgi:hypothetical protein